MRIERLRLHPFGAFDDLTVDFSTNLTVVYGPNEAGKSTVVNGLLAALFGRTRWSDHFAKRLGADAFDAVVPLGGDLARVELRFVVGGKRLTATCGWGARKDMTLVLPQGAMLENENAARELRKLLPAPPNVARTILFGDQSSLAETFDRLREDRNDALVSVADFANAASRADDGVSIERFRQELDRRIDAHFRHWDEKRGKPAATRAGGRREKHLGELAKAFNRMEDARDRLERAERLEREIDEAEIDSRRAREELATIEARLKRDEPTLKELRKRETLVSKRHLARSKRDERKNDYDAWLRAESVVEDSGRDATRLRRELEAATKNRTRAERFGELRARAEKYVKSQTAMEALERASAALENIPEVTRASVAAVQDAVTKLERANAALEASRIQASISAKKPLALDATIDGGERTTKRLDEDEIETFEAGAKIVLRSADWT
ncbi:MAG: AAA family ATPase, partial [Ignavibacteriales bacterium]|nr:AAA family ATPase [Ignavibacteriales bacterium]